MTGRLIIRPSAADLKTDKSFLFKADPYCVFFLGGQTARTSACKKGGKHPSWTDVIVFENASADILTVQLWDKDRITKDDFICAGSLDLATFMSSSIQTTSIDLFDKKSKFIGKLLLDVEWSSGIGSMGMGSVGMGSETLITDKHIDTLHTHTGSHVNTMSTEEFSGAVEKPIGDLHIGKTVGTLHADKQLDAMHGEQTVAPLYAEKTTKAILTDKTTEKLSNKSIETVMMERPIGEKLIQPIYAEKVTTSLITETEVNPLCGKQVIQLEGPHTETFHTESFSTGTSFQSGIHTGGIHTSGVGAHSYTGGLHSHTGESHSHVHGHTGELHGHTAEFQHARVVSEGVKTVQTERTIEPFSEEIVTKALVTEKAAGALSNVDIGKVQPVSEKIVEPLYAEKTTKALYTEKTAEPLVGVGKTTDVAFTTEKTTTTDTTYSQNRF